MLLTQEYQGGSQRACNSVKLPNRALRTEATTLKSKRKLNYGQHTGQLPRRLTESLTTQNCYS